MAITVRELIMNVFMEAEFGEDLNIETVAERAFGVEFGKNTKKHLMAKTKRNINYAIAALRDEGVFIYVGKKPVKPVKNYKHKNIAFQLSDSYVKCSPEEEQYIQNFVDRKKYKTQSEIDDFVSSTGFLKENNLIEENPTLKLE